MAKQSAYLKKLQQKKKQEMTDRTLFALQWGLDAALIAANIIFGAGPKRAKDFADAYNRIVLEIAELTREDSATDRSMEYTKAKVDEALKRICGEDFHPWDERYGQY